MTTTPGKKTKSRAPSTRPPGVGADPQQNCEGEFAVFRATCRVMEKHGNNYKSFRVQGQGDVASRSIVGKEHGNTHTHIYIYMYIYICTHMYT